DAVTDAREVATVYNLRVAEYHTYFVGRKEWEFSVWAHNAYVLPADAIKVDHIPNGGPANPALAGRTIYETDAAGNLRLCAGYDGRGLMLRRVDLVGRSDGGVPTPHVHEYTQNRNPAGEWFANPQRGVRPADPATEVP